MIQGMHYVNVCECSSGEPQSDVYSKWKINDCVQTAGVATFHAEKDMW